MAGLLTILNGRYARQLQRKWGLKGGNVVVDCSPEIMAVHNASSPPLEDRYLMDDRSVLGWVGGGAGAGTAVAQLKNPSGSGCLAIIECITWNYTTVAGTGALQIRSGTTQIANVTVSGNASWRDTRVGAGNTPNPGNPVCLLQLDTADAPSDTIVGTLSPMTQLPIAKSVGGHVQSADNGVCGLVLSPGGVWKFSASEAATNLNLTLYWRERPLEDAEK